MARIATPVVVVNVGLQAMGVVDTLMVGRLGGAAIAAVGLGNFYFFNVAVFVIGVLLAIDPVVSQSVGAGDDEGVALGIQRGLLLAVLGSGVVMLLLTPGELVLGLLRQPADVMGPTAEYTRRRLLGALPFLVFQVLRQGLQAMGTVRPVVVAVLLANGVNVAANWVFIHGHLGVRGRGVTGAGIATALSMWTMALLLGWLAWPRLRGALVPWRPPAWDRGPLWRLFLLGAPLGAQWFLESFAFGLTALCMGWMGTASLAGHEIALNLATLTFMVPLGISGAAAAVVGRAIGRGDLAAARRDAVAAIACGVGFMTLSAAVFTLAPGRLAALYVADPATLAVATALLPLAGVFQVFDGAQAVTGGVLRGTGDTRIPAILHMVAFWAVGVPLGAWLGFGAGLRERGLWWGLVAGLAAAAILQMARARVRLSRPVSRTRVDHPVPRARG